jgi:hypothetical protein
MDDTHAGVKTTPLKVGIFTGQADRIIFCVMFQYCTGYLFVKLFKEAHHACVGAIATVCGCFAQSSKYPRDRIQHTQVVQNLWIHN